MYQWCKTFKQPPSVYYDQYVEDIDIMNLCEGLVKDEELKESKRKMRKT